MTDQERIADLERRVDQLEDILERLTGDDGTLWCYTDDIFMGRNTKISKSDYIHGHCKFGKKDNKT